MRALVLEHVAHEDLAGFRAPIEAAGYTVASVHAPDGVPAREVLDADLLVVMGGPMGVYETGEHPWLLPEVAAIRARLAADQPTVGTCLGAQLIATALGARVYAGPTKEVGFAPLTLTPLGEASPLCRLEGVPVLHWHGDTFDLPAGTELLASTPRYAHQAYRRGGRLLAMQCHPEMGLPGGLERWLVGAERYLAEGGTSPGEVAADYRRLGERAVAAGRALLADWLSALR